MKRLLLTLALFTLVGFGAAPRDAGAIPLTWTVSGAFDDGGTFGGSFTYDADTNTMSTWSLTVAGGSVFPGMTYTDASGDFLDFEGDDRSFVFCDPNGCPNPGARRDLRLRFVTALTDAGGTIGIIPLINGPSPQYGFECNNCVTLREIVEGSATAPSAEAPEPGTLVLVSSVLVGLALSRRRRQAA